MEIDLAQFTDRLVSGISDAIVYADAEAALSRHEPIDVARCPRLDHHRPLKTNEAVANLGVVMPRHALPCRKGQHLHAQIGTLGYQFAASDRIIAAAPRQHRSVFPDPIHCRKYHG